MSLHTLILAAGEGRRFGDELKQLARVNGQTLLQRCVDVAVSLTPNQVSVVVGYQHQLLSPLLAHVNVIVNSNWSKGIGSSIACGVSALPVSASAVLIILCDQAALGVADYHLLQGCFLAVSEQSESHNIPIVCASYGDQLGVPAIFPKRFFPQLMALSGDVGAKKILYGNSVKTVQLLMASIDIDTQENLKDFIANQDRSLT